MKPLKELENKYFGKVGTKSRIADMYQNEMSEFKKQLYSEGVSEMFGYCESIKA